MNPAVLVQNVEKIIRNGTRAVQGISLSIRVGARFTDRRSSPAVFWLLE